MALSVTELEYRMDRNALLEIFVVEILRFLFYSSLKQMQGRKKEKQQETVHTLNHSTNICNLCLCLCLKIKASLGSKLHGILFPTKKVGMSTGLL